MANNATATTKAKGINAKVETKGRTTTITVVETDRIRDRVETAMEATSHSHNSKLNPNRWPPACPNNKCLSRWLSQLILKPLCYNSNSSNR